MATLRLTLSLEWFGGGSRRRKQGAAEKPHLPSCGWADPAATSTPAAMLRPATARNICPAIGPRGTTLRSMTNRRTGLPLHRPARLHTALAIRRRTALCHGQSNRRAPPPSARSLFPRHGRCPPRPRPGGRCADPSRVREEQFPASPDEATPSYSFRSPAWPLPRGPVAQGRPQRRGRQLVRQRLGGGRLQRHGGARDARPSLLLTTAVQRGDGKAAQLAQSCRVRGNERVWHGARSTRPPDSRTCIVVAQLYVSAYPGVSYLSGRGLQRRDGPALEVHGG